MDGRWCEMEVRGPTSNFLRVLGQLPSLGASVSLVKNGLLISWDSIICTLLLLPEPQFPLLSNEGDHNAYPAHSTRC